MNVTLTMEYLEDPMLLIEHVIQPQLFTYIYSNGQSILTRRQKDKHIS